MKLSFSRILPGALAFVIGAMAPMAHGHLFTTKDGRFIDGEIASVADGNAVIQSKDAKRTSVAIGDFVPADRDLVTAWQTSHSVAVTYSFEVTWAKEKVGSKVGAKSRHVKETKTTYITHITVRNKSRQAAEGVELHYQVHYTETEGKATIAKHHDGVIKLPTIPSAGTTVVDTDTVELEVTELAAGYHYTSGAPVRQSDSFKGIVATFTKDGKKIFEYATTGVTKAADTRSPTQPAPKKK